MLPSSPHPVRRQVRLELQAATSMFMHGADASGPAELRPPSIKSAVRWWYRAAVGPLVGPLCRPDGPPCGHCLRCHEAEVFGSTGVGPRIRFRVDEWRHSRSEGVLLPHRRRTGRPVVDRFCLPANLHFTLILDTLPLDSSVVHLRTAALAAWLATHLGGFGQRSRRGAGSVVLKNDGGSGIELARCSSPADVAELASFLASEVPTAVHDIRSTIRSGAMLQSLGTGQVPPYPSLLLDKPRISRIVVSPTGERNEEDARAWVMRTLFKHPVWGLPFQPPPGLGGQAIKGNNVRQASPVWVHLHPTREGYAAVFTLLRSQGSQRNAQAAPLLQQGFARLHSHLDQLPGSIDISRP